MAATRKKKESAERPRTAESKKKPAGSSGSAPSGRKSSPAVYTDPDLRDRLKAEIRAGDKGGEPGQWSARKSQLLASAYKEAGGGYKKGPKAKTDAQKGLDEWTEQDWTTRDGEPAGRDGETARYLPEAAWQELTPAQRRATDRKKKAASREGQQHVANTPAARRARKKATS